MPLLPDKMADDLTPAARRRLYRLGQAAVVVAAGYGLINGDEADLWLLALAIVLDVARRNVPNT
jgi:hypothetical protein